MATFVIKFVTENFTKSPNLVTLIAKRRQRNQSYKENISVNVHYTDFKHSAWLKILNRLIMSVALNYTEKFFTEYLVPVNNDQSNVIQFRYSN